MKTFLKRGLFGVIPLVALSGAVFAFAASPVSIAFTFLLGTYLGAAAGGAAILWLFGSSIALYIALIYFFYVSFWKKIYSGRSLFFILGISVANFLFSVVIVVLPPVMYVLYGMTTESISFRGVAAVERKVTDEISENREDYIMKMRAAQQSTGYPCLFFDIRGDLKEIPRDDFDALASTASEKSSKAMVCYVKGFEGESNFNFCFDKDEVGRTRECAPFSSLEELFPKE